MSVHRQVWITCDFPDCTMGTADWFDAQTVAEARKAAASGGFVRRALGVDLCENHADARATQVGGGE